MKVIQFIQKLFLSVLFLVPFVAHSAEVSVHAAAGAGVASATSERAGITYLRSQISDMELEYYKTKQVPEELARKMDEVFGRKEVQEAFENCRLVRSRARSAMRLLEDQYGFKFFMRDCVFEHTKFPGLIFKIDKANNTRAVGRVLRADITNAIACERNFKVLRAVEKQLYFAKRFSCKNLATIVVEPKIQRIRRPNEEVALRIKIFDSELGVLYQLLPCPCEDISYVNNSMGGTIIDTEDWYNETSADAEKYLTRYFPDFVKSYKAKRAKIANQTVRALLLHSRL